MSARRQSSGACFGGARGGVHAVPRAGGLAGCGRQGPACPPLGRPVQHAPEHGPAGAAPAARAQGGWRPAAGQGLQPAPVPRGGAARGLAWALADRRCFTSLLLFCQSDPASGHFAHIRHHACRSDACHREQALLWPVCRATRGAAWHRPEFHRTLSWLPNNVGTQICHHRKQRRV